MSDYTGSFARTNLSAAQVMEAKRKEATFLSGIRHPLLSELTDRAAKDQKNDFEYRVFTRPYPIIDAFLWGESSGSQSALTNSATAMYITNAASYLRPNDLLQIPGQQDNIQTAGNKTILGEVVRVSSIASTHIVNVVRNVKSGTALDNAGTGTGNDGLAFMVLSSAEPVGGGTRDAKGLGKGDRLNYIRSFNEPFSLVQQMVDNVDFFPMGGKGEKDDQQQDAFIRITDAVEKMLLYGQLSKTTDGSGRTVYDSAGLLALLNTTDTEEGIVAWTTGATGTDMVIGDRTSRIWHADDGFNIPNIGRFMTELTLNGNMTKWGYHGNRFLPNWDNQWGDTIQRTQSLTDYGVTVNSHSVYGSKINFVYSPVMDLADPTGCFFIDMPHFALAVMNDIHLRQPDHDPKSEVGSRTYDYDWIADLGCGATFLKSHAYIFGVNDIA